MMIDHCPTVLIVEDEPLVRMHGCDLLESAGFDVIEAQTADEALDLLERHGHVRLLFSDVDMPGSMDGLELARRVHLRWPKIGLLMTSGHHRLTPEMIPDHGRFIAKPWRENNVLAEMRAILAS
ncbi:response regulator [Sphingomonas sp. TZW2008]|uniref:response regulator n=1 Tax=Sphingomonas sp. TZW2008 TaxID=1917973 RepID=UPI001C4F6F93|nr:response regulator [Sphingomonas sp. TZW2008]